jgi:hypothetical protein
MMRISTSIASFSQRIPAASLAVSIGLWMSVQVAVAGGDGQWISLKPMSLARQETGAARSGGTVYVAGGLLSNFSATATVETYDIASGRWSSIPNMPQPRDHAGVAALGGLL